MNNNNKEEEKDNNQNNNGDLKMLNDIIQDNAFPKFDQIINPYYQTNYLPPDIFTKSKLFTSRYFHKIKSTRITKIIRR